MTLDDASIFYVYVHKSMYITYMESTLCVYVLCKKSDHNTCTVFCIMDVMKNLGSRENVEVSKLSIIRSLFWDLGSRLSMYIIITLFLVLSRLCRYMYWISNHFLRIFCSFYSVCARDHTKSYTIHTYIWRTNSVTCSL
jgi:hypothetical protein